MCTCACVARAIQSEMDSRTEQNETQLASEAMTIMVSQPNSAINFTFYFFYRHTHAHARANTIACVHSCPHLFLFTCLAGQKWRISGWLQGKQPAGRDHPVLYQLLFSLHAGWGVDSQDASLILAAPCFASLFSPPCILSSRIWD